MRERVSIITINPAPAAINPIANHVSRPENDGKCQFGIVAIENTLAGSLLPNYNLIQKHKFHVVGEVYLHIVMNLLANPGVKIEDIKEIWSHPVAIAQCENFLEKYPGVELVEFHDTAAAAKWSATCASGI